MIELTRLDGESVWVNPDQLFTVEPPLPNDHAKAGARLWVGGKLLLVHETVDDVITEIWER